MKLLRKFRLEDRTNKGQPKTKGWPPSRLNKRMIYSIKPLWEDKEQGWRHKTATKGDKKG